MDTNIEVLTPIWVLKSVVERDYEAWAMFNNPKVVVNDPYYTGLLEEDELGEEEVQKVTFPEYDSTAKMLEILEKHNVLFDPVTGGWID